MIRNILKGDYLEYTGIPARVTMGKGLLHSDNRENSVTQASLPVKFGNDEIL